MIFYFYTFYQLFAWACLDHSISSLNFYEGPKSRKIVLWYLRSQTSYFIYHVLTQWSKKKQQRFLFILMWGLVQDKNSSVHKYKGFCIYIAEKFWKLLSRQIINQIISSQPSLYFFLLTILVHEIRNDSCY